MAITNLSKEEVIEKGDLNDKKKQTIESQMVKQLNRYWDQISSDWATIFEATGTNINVESYRQELEAILRDAYRKTINWFKNDFKRSLELSLSQAETDEDRTHYEALLLLRSKIEPAFIVWITQYLVDMPPKQATFILNTTRDIISKRTNATIIDAIESGEGFLTSEEIARRTKTPLADENKNRSPQIAENEVGIAATDSQLEEGGLFQNELSQTPLAATTFLEKTWFNLGDKAVRPAHRVAGGQRRLLNELFLVMAQLLKAPRDRNHGATAANTSGCRCYLIIS